jgi:hypothetical protein
MTREQIDDCTTVAVIRSMAAAAEVLEEFKHRYPEDEPLIEAIHQRQKEALTMLIPLPDVKHSGK